MLRSSSCLFALAFASFVSAQQHLVVPSGFANQDGNGRELVPGFVGSGREQLLVGASHLSAMVGKTIQAIEFRRHNFDAAFVGAAANVSVTMSISPQSPLQTSSVFAQNAGPNPVQVFQGQVTAPSSPQPAANATIGWTNDNIVRVVFQTPFLYQGGTLCIDIAGVEVPQLPYARWTADAVFVPSDATVVDLGPGTGPHANHLGQWSFVGSSELSAGSHAEMLAVGGPYTFCVAMLGHAAPFPVPLNALGIGAPGAMCYLDEIYLSQLTVLAPPPVPGLVLGVGHWDLWLPNQPWILGAELASQWLELPGWNVSNGIRFTVATAMPTLDMAMVTGGIADPEGTRTVNLAHIVRFEHSN